MDKTTIKEVVFKHVVLEGTSYEVGRMQGELLKKDPELVSFYTSPRPNFGSFNKYNLDFVFHFNEEFCPGINDELQGIADSLDVPVEQIIYYAATYPAEMGNCSHMVVLPEITGNHHLYVGRSYEWSWDDELRLCTTKVTGKASHIGFSLFLSGRFDGINQHGLCVTMSAGVPGSFPNEKGCRFWAVLRSLLDNCKTVNDAIYRVQKMPIAFNFNLLIADRAGEAALIEIACSHKSVQRIGPSSLRKYLCSTNHYTSKDMIEFDNNRMWQSVARYNSIESGIKTAIPNVSEETLKGILSATVPDGVCCHYYTEGLGTLWSMIFDVTDVNVEICFGSPVYNPWHTFEIDMPPDSREYKAKFPNEEVENPIFWNRLLPGENIATCFGKNCGI
jgi:predicted choloylglycine hydrolase